LIKTRLTEYPEYRDAARQADFNNDAGTPPLPASSNITQTA